MAHIKGIGTDIIEVNRIERDIQKYGDRFLNRVFTSKEQEYCFTQKKYAERFAGRFAAKEAVAKAFGTGFSRGVFWKDIEILNNKEGQPYAVLSQDLQYAFPNSSVLLSISHCRSYATAVALIIQTDNKD